MHRPRTALGALGLGDLNASLDASHISTGGGLDTTARLESRKSLSSSAVGRMSFIKSAPGTAKKPTFGVGRPSIASKENVDRRLSMATGKVNSGASVLSAIAAKRADMPDPRPINSASWKAEAAQKVFDLLTATEYPQRVSTKLLLGPTAKDFQAILTHMLRCIDPHYIMSGKLEDDVAAVAKSLNYPFTPSKTAIATVGASHSWPPLLGLLAWLGELISYHSAMREVQEEENASLAAATASGNLASAVGSHTHFWAYLQSTYTAYLAGEDDAVERAEAGISRAFDGAAAAQRAEESAAEALLASANAELEALTHAASALPSARAANAELVGDISRLDAALTEMIAYRDGLLLKKSEKTAELNALAHELARLRDDADRLRNVVDHQELSQEDVRRMRASAVAMRERIAATQERREAVSKEVGFGSEELKKRLGALDARLRDYHDRARMLQLVPKGAKYSFGVDFSLSLDTRALERVSAPNYGADEGDRRAAASALVGSDMKGVIKKNIRYLKTCFIKNASDLRTSILSATTEATECNERRAALVRSIEESETATAALESMARREAEAGDARLAEGAAEIARCVANCADRRSTASAAHSRAKELSPAVLAELAASIASLEASQLAERQRMSDLIARCLLRVSEHKQSTRAKLDAAAASVITAKNRITAAERDREARFGAVM